MVGKILKGLAVATGTGLAIGFGSKQRAQATTQATTMSDSSDNILERLDRFEARLSAVEARPTADIESLVGPRVEELRARILAEMRDSMQTSLTNFEQALDTKVSLRMATLEKALIDQSAIVTALSQRAIEAEENFQRLISAVERLCERNERPVLDLPFERQLSEAFQRQPAPSALPLDSGFRPRIVQEDDGKARHRRPLSKI